MLNDPARVDRLLGLFLGDMGAESTHAYLDDPSTVDRVMARLAAFGWRVEVNEAADESWRAEVTNTEGPVVVEGPTRKMALCVAALKAAGLLQ